MVPRSDKRRFMADTCWSRCVESRTGIESRARSPNHQYLCRRGSKAGQHDAEMGEFVASAEINNAQLSKLGGLKMFLVVLFPYKIPKTNDKPLIPNLEREDSDLLKIKETETADGFFLSREMHYAKLQEGIATAITAAVLNVSSGGHHDPR